MHWFGNTVSKRTAFARLSLWEQMRWKIHLSVALFNDSNDLRSIRDHRSIRHCTEVVVIEAIVAQEKRLNQAMIQKYFERGTSPKPESSFDLATDSNQNCLYTEACIFEYRRWRTSVTPNYCFTDFRIVRLYRASRPGESDRGAFGFNSDRRRAQYCFARLQPRHDQGI